MANFPFFRCHPELSRVGASARLIALSSLVSSFVLAGCATALPPRYVKARDLGPSSPTHPPAPPLAEGQPLIIEFAEGDVIPLVVSVEGDLVTTSPTGPLSVVVKRHFFLKVEGQTLRTSLDGRSFDKPKTPGTFRFGLDVQRDKGVQGEIRLVMPSP